MLDIIFFGDVSGVAGGPGGIVPPAKGETAAGMKNGGPQAAVVS
jgi:hypothetical protein